MDDYRILETEELAPDAVRGMEAFTNLGYKPHEAMADIIDNSIAADATRIRITNNTLYGTGYLTRTLIADNGIGMSREKLFEAMRFGSRAEMNSDLSAFGLGMKSASLQVAARLVVISRDKTGEISAYAWDKESQIENPWGVHKIEPRTADIQSLDKVADGRSGTLIIWDDANLKLSDSEKRWTKDQSRVKERIDTEISNYLSLVFHRFLSGTAKSTQQIEIIYDGESLEPFDPVDERTLASPEKYTSQKFQFTEKAIVDGQEIELPYSLQPFQLDDNPDGEFYDLSQQTMDYQGIYCYRADRLIQWPTWLGFVTSKHNDQNKTRLIFEFDTGLTKTLRTNVMKTAIQLTPGMIEEMRPIVSEVRTVARIKYTKKRKEENNEETPDDIHSSASRTIEATRDSQYPLPQMDDDGPNRVRVDSKYGDDIVLRLKSISESESEAYRDAIEAVDDLDGGNLWEPFKVGMDIRIRLNRNHDFYQKFYLTNLGNPEAIEALDLLLWSLARAELHHAVLRDQFEDIRTLVSQDLRRVAESHLLPNLKEGLDARENMISPREE